MGDHQNMAHLARDVRLMRLQIDNMAPRLASVEQSFHGLLGEVGRGFSQVSQQFARHDARFDSISAGIDALRNAFRSHADEVMRAMRRGGGE